MDNICRQVKFNEGDQVWLALGRYKLKGDQNAKISPKREGPYTIKRIVTGTPLAYELDLPYESKIHPVISIQYLTKYECDNDPFERRPAPPGPLEYEEYPGDTDEDGKVYEVERVVIDPRKERPGNI